MNTPTQDSRQLYTPSSRSVVIPLVARTRAEHHLIWHKKHARRTTTQMTNEINGKKVAAESRHIISCPTMRASHFRGGVCANDSPAKVTLRAAPPPTPKAGYTVPLIRMTASSSPWPRGAPPTENTSMGRSVKSNATPITSPSLSCLAENRRPRRDEKQGVKVD